MRRRSRPSSSTAQNAGGLGRSKMRCLASRARTNCSTLSSSSSVRQALNSTRAYSAVWRIPGTSSGAQYRRTFARPSASTQSSNHRGYGPSHFSDARKNRPNHPPICGNASSHASANLSAGLSRPDSILDTVEASQGTIAPSSASVIPAASRARLTSAPKKCSGEAPGSRSRLPGMPSPCGGLHSGPEVRVPGLAVADGYSITSNGSPGLGTSVAGTAHPANLLRDARSPAKTRRQMPLGPTPMATDPATVQQPSHPLYALTTYELAG